MHKLINYFVGTLNDVQRQLYLGFEASRGAEGRENTLALVTGESVAKIFECRARMAQTLIDAKMVHQCGCARCLHQMLPDKDIHASMNVLIRELNEEQKKTFFAIQSLAGETEMMLAVITGYSEKVIGGARFEIDSRWPDLFPDCPQNDNDPRKHATFKQGFKGINSYADGHTLRHKRTNPTLGG